MRKKTKFLLLRATILLGFALLAGRLWYLQVVMAGYYRAQADTSKIRDEPVQALRGIVYDRYGRPLVLNVPSWNAEIVPHGVPVFQRRSEYAFLSRILGGYPTAGQIESLVRQNEWRPYAPFVVKAAISTDTAMLIKQLHRRLPGIRAEATSVRDYTHDSLFSLSHLMGYASRITAAEYQSARRDYPSEHVTSLDLAGQSGIEGLLDSYLHGVNGTDKVEVDAGERPVRVLRRGATVSGDSVYLTLDWRLQRRVAADLQAGLHQLNVRQGVAIVEDVHSGQILSMVSLPSYDSNLFSSGTGIKQTAYSRLLQDPAHPLSDQAAGGLFPPGSTFKVVTATAGLQTHVIDGSRTIDDTGLIKLCSQYDASSCQYYYGWLPPPGLGAVNVVGALGESSDIFFYTVAGGNPNVDPNMKRVGADRLALWARLFGFGQQIGSLVPDEQAGLIPSKTWYDRLLKTSTYYQPDHPIWSIGDTYNMAIGQGLDYVTPLQIVNMAATIANGGIVYRPTVVQRVVGRIVPRLGVLKQPKAIQPFVPSILRRNFIDPDNLALVQEGMHQSVLIPEGAHGTSYNVADPRFDPAGKTGTAESPGGPDAWWVGYAPYRNPQVAVVVLVPHAFSEGATAAAPIAHKVFEDYFGLPAKKNWLSDVQRFLVPNSTGRAG